MRNLVIILFFFLAVGLVAAIPSIPNVFSGTVTYPDDPEFALVGQEISASIEGTDLGVVGEVGAGGSYEVMVDPEGRTGTITFYIGGVEASPTAEYETGQFTDLDLEIDEEPSGTFCGNDVKEVGEQCDGTDLNSATCANVVGTGWTGTVSCDDSCSFDITACVAPTVFCGDGTCNNGETCSSCSADCGTCPPAPAGGSSGGGGSSSSSTPDCNDKKDNDNDDLIDLLDPGCTSLTDDNEFNVEVEDEVVNPAATRQTIVEGGNQEEYAEGNVNTYANPYTDSINSESNSDGLTGALIGASGKTTLLYGLLILAIVAALLGGIVFVKRSKVNRRIKKTVKRKK
ncbi:MAG: YrhC family protein [Nanoarchaeota archaeon]|nr:YrhC family protein [Nanoarchaeota archaeon]